jgi:predicted phosphodiesterase
MPLSRASKPWRDGEFAIAHLSDLHFGTSKYLEVWDLTEQFLRKSKPDLLLITGDLVDTPTEPLYTEVKKTLDALDIDYFVCPGNHDRYHRGNRVPNRAIVVVMLVLILCVVIVASALSWILKSLPVGILGISLAVALGWLAKILLQLGVNKRLLEDKSIYEVFKDNLLPQGELKPYQLPKSSNGIGGTPAWKIGLFGADSNASADALARGYLPSPHFQRIRLATQGADFDLCIFLVHHHLLPIRSLEASRQDTWADLLNVTSMVNAGSLLETLSEAQVNLVLHGHEHAHNFAAYQSLQPASGLVQVLAAGSATGNKTLKGCAEGDATFNLLILSDDRSVRVQRYFWNTNKWGYDSEVDLGDGASLRFARLARRLQLSQEIDCTITKFVRFTREGDIQVYWVFTNWNLPQEQFEQKVFNSTGWVERVEMRVSYSVDPFSYSAASRPLDGSAKPDPKAPNWWLIRAKIPADYRNRSVKLEIFLCWRNGAILTKEQMVRDQVSGRSRGTPRENGSEFVTGWTPGEQAVAALDLIVSIPEEYVPASCPDEPPQIKVVVVDHNEMPLEHEKKELDRSLRILAPGCYSLRVAYPHEHHYYQIAWSPPPQSLVDERVNTRSFPRLFYSNARKRGQALLEIMRGQLEAAVPAVASFSLYGCRQDDSADLERLAYIADPVFGSKQGHEPAESVSLMRLQHSIVRAWMGAPAVIQRPLVNEEAEDKGFVEAELLLICYPLRFGYGSINPPTWGVLRLGVSEAAQNLENDWNSEKTSTALMTSVIFLIAGALRAD